MAKYNTLLDQLESELRVAEEQLNAATRAVFDAMQNGTYRKEMTDGLKVVKARRDTIRDLFNMALDVKEGAGLPELHPAGGPVKTRTQMWQAIERDRFWREVCERGAKCITTPSSRREVKILGGERVPMAMCDRCGIWREDVDR